MAFIPPRFTSTLVPGSVFVGNVTICWDEAIQAHEQDKIDKYTPLAAIINDENQHEGV